MQTSDGQLKLYLAKKKKKKEEEKNILMEESINGMLVVFAYYPIYHPADRIVILGRFF